MDCEAEKVDREGMRPSTLKETEAIRSLASAPLLSILY